MALTAFQVLDRAIEMGGANLSGRDLAGSGKAASDTLADLCSKGFLEKGARSRYALTDKGRQVWQDEAPPERKQQLEAAEGQKQKKLLIELLEAVNKKAGKTFSQKELNRIPDTLLASACEQKLIELVKARAYRLLPAGEQVVRGVPLQRLRDEYQEILARWEATQKKLGQQVEGVDSTGSQSLQAVAADLMERGRQAGQAFDSALAEMGAFDRLVHAARQIRASTEEACRKALEQLEQEKSRLAELESQLRQSASSQREELEQLERRMGQRLDEIQQRMAAAEKAAPQPTVTETASPSSDDAVWEATRKAYEDLRQETLRIGGFVKIPELTDRVRTVHPALSPTAFHDLLKQWQQQDRLTLQLCNDRELEKRAREGIESPHGLLFYIHVR